MEKYTAIVKRSKDTYEKNLENALCEICKMQEDGELIRVSTLMKRTGLSRAYFYNNRKISEKIRTVQQEQGIKNANEKSQAQMIKVLRQANELLKRELKNKNIENEVLKEEVKRLREQMHHMKKKGAIDDNR